MNTVDNLAGKYKHFKGQYYTLLCRAYIIGSTDTEYVLYRQEYGTKGYWIRPAEMFFESVTLPDQTTVPRFCPTEDDRHSYKESIEELFSVGKDHTSSVVIRNSEDDRRMYCVINKDENNSAVLLFEIYHNGGFLSDTQLLFRLGYSINPDNGDFGVSENPDILPENLRLRIWKDEWSPECDEYEAIPAKQIKSRINPCSIDLPIDSDFLIAKRGVVDPFSIVAITSATEMWKEAKMRQSGKETYFVLKPGKTVLTHTKNRIKLPEDCAAKIEIKSTFARLSLSVTTGDFCNPGWDGYYPLQITNNGRNSIVIHPGDIMAQMMLIPVCGDVYEEYVRKASHMDTEKGFDYGNPFNFWRERAIKRIRDEKKGMKIYFEFYQRILNRINDENDAIVSGADRSATEERFKDKFLPYCEKRHKKHPEDTRKNIMSFFNKEKKYKNISSTKWLPGFSSVIGFIISFLGFLGYKIDNNTAPNAIKPFIELINDILNWSPWMILLFSITLFVVFLALKRQKNKVYCTFESAAISKIISEAGKESE